MRLLLVVTCLVAVSGLRRKSSRKHRNGNATSGAFVALTGDDCDQLEGIVVGGRDLGKPAVMICRVWPQQFGDFPVDSAKALTALFNGGEELFKEIRNLSKATDSPFCWKRLGVRELLRGKGAQNSTKESEAADCDMEVFGKCFGDCPDGMKPAAIIGGVSPVCSSACMQSTHQTPCGFGCAKGVGTCAKTLADQVTVVARSVGQVASYMSGNPAISQVVDKILRLAEFFIEVVFKIVKLAKHVMKELNNKEQEKLAVIVALVQFVFEHAKTIKQDLFQLNENFGETMEMVLEVMDGEFEWHEINLEFISDTILKHGASILGAATDFAQAFVFPKCKVTSNTNPEYDCNDTGENDCRSWSYKSARCHDNGDQCEYRYKFGDMRLAHSCRCKNSKKK